MPDSLALLQKLIRCPSITPVDAGAQQSLKTALEALGFTVDIIEFSAPGTEPVQNLFAKIGSTGPHLMFAGHTDVVPVGDPAQWQDDPFAAVVRDGRLYGRGAADMKGGIAAFVAAVGGYLEATPGLKGTISLLITGDEEGPAINGTAKLLDWAAARGERFDAAIVGEPTNPEQMGDMIKIGRRGSLTGTVRVSGIQGHVAYPHLARNPMPTMSQIVAALYAEPLDSGTEHFQPSNLEVTTIDASNPASNVIPGDVQATFNIRFNDSWSAGRLKYWVAERINSVRSECDVILEFLPVVSDVFRTQSDALIAPMAQAVQAITGRTPALSTSGGTSDARFIKNFCPVIEFGLVGQTMHKVDENIAVADLHQLTAIYRRFLENYFG